MPTRYVCQKCVSVRLFTVKPCYYSLESTLELILHRGKPTFSLVPSPPVNRTFSSVLCPKLNLHAGPPCFDFSKKSRGRNNANYAFQYKFKNRPGQYRAKKNKKRKNKLGAFTTGYSRRVTHPVL